MPFDLIGGKRRRAERYRETNQRQALDDLDSALDRLRRSPSPTKRSHGPYTMHPLKYAQGHVYHPLAYHPGNEVHPIH